MDAILKNRLGSRSLVWNRVGGGSINDAFRVVADGRQLFCKINSAYEFPHLFLKEKKGLDQIGKESVIRVPEVVDCFEEEGKQVLLLEWINEGERTEVFWKKFGEQLAALHHKTHVSFGFYEDNFMGSVAQHNTFVSSWTDFFIHYRLMPLVQQCRQHGLLSAAHVSQSEYLSAKLSDFFNDNEKPALVHGDLWSGNFLCSDQSEPVLIDPAVYFGHRSVDMAMTTLFGGFRQPFYDAYQYHFPLPSNYKEQWDICNLYPLLIHLILFGKTYLSQIDGILRKYC